MSTAGMSTNNMSSATTLSEWLAPCGKELCIYHFVLPRSAVEVTYTYLRLHYSNPTEAVVASQSYLREMASDARQRPDTFPNKYADLWPLFPELVERIYLVHGIFATLKWLHHYVEYLDERRWPTVVLRFFYTHIHDAVVELGAVSDTVRVYSVVRVLKPPCPAIRRIGEWSRMYDVPWEDIWLISGNEYNAHAHNYLTVAETAAKTVGCKFAHTALSEFMP